MTTHTIAHAFQELRKLIQSNCGGRNKFVNDDGERCILGEMLHAVGVTDAAMLDTGMSSLQYDRLRTHWPFLTYLRLDLLARTNDAHETVEARRDGLLKLVDEWEGL